MAELTPENHYDVHQSLKELPSLDIKNLGCALGLSYTKLEKMKDPLNDTIAAWLRKEDYVLKRSGKPSWKTLVCKLKEIGQNGIAEMINAKELVSSANSSTDHHHPSESGTITPNDIAMFITLDEAYDISTDSALHTFAGKLQEVLKIPTGTELKPCCSEPGSTKLTFQLPCCVVQNVFPLSKEQETDLSNNGVCNLWFIYQFNRQEMLKDLEQVNQGETSNSSSNDLDILPSVESYDPQLVMATESAAPTMSHSRPALGEAEQSESTNPQATNFRQNGTPHSDDEVIDSEYKIGQELEKIKDSFMSLLTDVQDRLSRRVSTKTITTFVVKHAKQFKGDRGSQQCLIVQQDLKHATSTDDVFTALSTHWSFLEHKMLVSIVNCLGGRKIRQRLKEYQKKLKKFLKNRRMSQFPIPLRCIDNTIITKLSETHKRVILKLDLKDPSWDDIVNLKESICKVLEILPSALLICKIEHGCVKITFYIPNLTAQEIFKEPLKEEQIKALTSTPVMTLSVTRENVIFTNESCKDFAEQEAIDEIESLSCSTLTDTDVFDDDLTESKSKDETMENGQQTTDTQQRIQSKAASTTGYSDSGRGTMTHCQSTIADDEEPDHTFNSGHDDQNIEPHSRIVDVDTNKLLPSDSNTLSLHQASFRGDLNEVKRLTEEQNYNPLQRDKDGNTALHYAAKGDHAKVLKYFIQEQQCSSVCRSKVRLTPLHTAALCCSQKVIKYLTEEESMELLDTDVEGFTPLHRACVGGDITIVQYLVNKMKEVGTKIEDIIYSRTKSGDNPIHFASLHGHQEVVKFLIKELECDPNIKGQWDKTPLQYAAQGGHQDIVEYLIEEEKCEYSSENDAPLHLAAEHGHLQVLKYLTMAVQYNPQSKNADGRTALSSAALYGHLNVVKFITLDLKCDPSIADENGKLPLHSATQNGHMEIAKFFVEELACDPAQCLDKTKETPLHVAAKKGHLDLVKYLSTRMSSSLSNRNSNGETPLNLAALYGCHDVLKYFISELKCDPNTLGQYNRTPLHSAAQQGYLDTVKYLVEDQKCDPCICKGEDKVTPLHVAAKYGHLPVVQYLTREHHCDPLRENVAEENSLICSARNGHLNVIEYFIKELDIDPNAPGPRKRTALHYAAGSGHLDVVRYLIESCSCFPSSCQNDDKVTPLHVAAEGGHLHVVKYLIEHHRCSPITRDKYPFLPLHYAAKHGHLEVVRYFVEDCMCLPNISGYRDSKPLDLARYYGHNHIVKYLTSKIDEIHNTP